MSALSSIIAAGTYPEFVYQRLIATGAAGSGSFTPSLPARGIATLMQLRVGGCYLFRFDDAGQVEIGYGFYTAAGLITRPAAGLVYVSTGAVRLTLTANAVATVINEAGLYTRLRAETICSITPNISNSTATSAGLSMTADGTAAGVPLADTSLFTRQITNKVTSVTTANGAGGQHSANLVTNRNAGFHLSCRWGVSQLPTAPRLFVGLHNGTSALAADPSARLDFAAFAKDSADTNIQMMVNDGSGTASKQDTAITMVINTLYESLLWCDPAGATVYGLLIDYTNQAVWYGTAASNLPTAGAGLGPQYFATLNGTDTGTAAIFHIGGMYLRTGP